jgi:serine/threonine-protein kinase
MLVSTNVRLLRPLGEGGMGSVWIADHVSLRTQVVVKFMSKELASSGEAVARFSREAAAASQVKSPHVVQMLDHGVAAEPLSAPYIVMELLEGRDLEHHIRAVGKLLPGEALAIVVQLSRALSKAHERGIVHRDIKPSNVFLCDAGAGELFVKLLDFGIAKGPEVGIAGSTTRTGSLVGSPYYMSPEQVVGAKNIDYRTDLWSLGVVAYEALTAQRPFHGETMGALALKIHRDPLPKPTGANPALPSAVDAWFARACAREPDERFTSAKEMADALATALRDVVPPGISTDSGRTPKPIGLETTLADAAPKFRSASDARSETGAGVGLASQKVHASSRARWMILAGIAAGAIGIGFIVPRLTRSEPPKPAPELPSAAAAVSTPTPTPTASATPTPTPTATATATATTTATTTATPTTTTTTTAAATSTLAPTATWRRPRPAPSATPSSAPAKPTPPPSDDDIK